MQLNKTIIALSLAAIAGTVSAQEVVVKIGHSGPLSGSQAFAGKDNENGVRMAIEELNAQPITVGGKKVKFELVSEDDQADPKSGVAAAQKMVDAGVKYVLGPYNSGVTIPASRVYSEAGVVEATVASNPKITQAGYKNLFRIAASDTQLGSKMALYAANELKLKQVAVIDDRTAFGQGVAEEFKKQAKLSGMTVVGHDRQGIGLQHHPDQDQGQERPGDLLRRLRSARRADGTPDETAGPERQAARRRHHLLA